MKFESEPGDFEVYIGTSSQETPLTFNFALRAGEHDE